MSTLPASGDVLPRRTGASRGRQPRIVFFIHDGTGLGHLRRVSLIAKGLQGDCACLIVSGHRSASWMVPDECEYVHLPSLDSLLPRKASYWNREPFLRASREEAVALRKKMLEAVIRAFDPDALVVDFFPLGKFGELNEVVTEFECRKYFILRGVLDSAQNVQPNILKDQGDFALEQCFDRIFVTSDLRIVDVGREYGFSDAIMNKVQYVGYVSARVGEQARVIARAARGVLDGERWVVCSAGGGVLGESLTKECIAVASSCHTRLVFDVVAGPKSALAISHHTDCIIDGRNRYMRECRSLPLMNASADVVVCSGGYNAIVEALEGSARIICHPTQQSCDEQSIHPERLGEYCDISICSDLDDLKVAISDAAARPPRGHAVARTLLEFEGIETIRDVLYKDLRVSC